ncbi:MAG: restriction endonuclease [Betaproteobacteria bacterium]|nr:restriction endonuclease [Betaproteobacteria bacterium]MCC7218880.1 restriction endonuclease [Burkholderiales bacterium]
MNENSLFAILLRSPWWVSMAIAAAVTALAVALMPESWRVFGIVTGAPFFVIGCIALWKQLQRPSAARVARTTEALRAMAWPEFADVLEAGYRADGAIVTRIRADAADFTVKKQWRITLVSGKRFKVARTGVEPLRELLAAKDAHEAHDCAYVTLGEVSDNARKFAADNRIGLIGGPELAALLPAAGRTRKRR